MIADRSLTTSEAADALGVHVNTVKSWLIQLPVPAHKDGHGRWRVDLQALEVLQAIKRLRDQDRTFETIRQKLEPEALLKQDGPTITVEAAAEPIEPQPMAMVPRVAEVLGEQAKLADKLARAAHSIGRMEAELDGMRLALTEAHMEIAALRGRRWWQRLLNY